MFTFGYVEAMRSTMLLPVVLLGVGALSCLLLRERKPTPSPEPAAGPEPTAATAGADLAAVADAEPSTQAAG